MRVPETLLRDLNPRALGPSFRVSSWTPLPLSSSRLRHLPRSPAAPLPTPCLSLLPHWPRR